MKCALSFTNCTTAKRIIEPFPALCPRKPPGKGKQSNGMFGTQQEMSRSTPGISRFPSLLGHLELSPSDQEADLSDILWAAERQVSRLEWVISQVHKMSKCPKSSSTRKCKSKPISAEQLYVIFISLLSSLSPREKCGNPTTGSLGLGCVTDS